MRVHGKYAQLQLWRASGMLKDFARPEYLVAVRLEPVIHQGIRIPQTAADLVFRAEHGYVTIPCVLVDGPQLVAREGDRFIWPYPAAAVLDDATALSIESAVMPWLRSVTLGRALNEETVRHYGTPADREVFERARALQYAGAAPYARCVAALAPYVYAARYAASGSVIVRSGNDLLQGAAYLSKLSPVGVCCETGAERQTGIPWFAGLQITGAQEAPVLIVGRDCHDCAAAPETVLVETDPDAGATAALVEASHAYPMDFMFRFEPLHGPPVRRFTVAVPDAPMPAQMHPRPPYRAKGGSSGRVLIGVRPDWKYASDSDTDSALELAALLREEGLQVDIAGRPHGVDFKSYDVAHYFGLLEPKGTLDFLTRAKAAGIRTVLTPAYADVSEGLAWGVETAQSCFSQEMDDASLGRYLYFMARRALFLGSWQTVAGPPYPEYEGLVREALSLTDVVIAESPPEAALMRRKFGGLLRRLETCPPVMAPVDAPRVRPPVQAEDFVLLHAAVEPRANQLFAIHAAQTAGRAMVIAGETRDMDYALKIRAIAGDRVFFVERPAPEQVTWLYARAATILDASWFGLGTARLCRAADSGAKVVASTTGWGPAIWPAMLAADPASPESIAAALNAPSPPSVPTEPGEPGERLRIILAAYRASASGALPPSSSPLEGPISHV